jgi:hypothetical protein
MDKRLYDLTEATDLTGRSLMIDKSGEIEAEKYSAEGLGKYVKVELSSAEIKALNSSPKQLVAAPGAGKILIPTFAMVKYTYGTIPYATNTSGAIDYPSVFNGLIDLSNTSYSGSANKMTYAAMLKDPYSDTLASAENKALTFWNPSADPTAGDGTLTVHLWYKEITL